MDDRLPQHAPLRKGAVAVTDVLILGGGAAGEYDRLVRDWAGVPGASLDIAVVRRNWAEALRTWFPLPIHLLEGLVVYYSSMWLIRRRPFSRMMFVGCRRVVTTFSVGFIIKYVSGAVLVRWLSMVFRYWVSIVGGWAF